MSSFMGTQMDHLLELEGNIERNFFLKLPTIEIFVAVIRHGFKAKILETRISKQPMASRCPIRRH